MRLVSEGKGSLQDMLFHFRERMKQIFLACLEKTKAGVLSTMLLGDRTGLDPDIREMYQSAGISHILAISGVKIVCSIYLFCQKPLLYGVLRQDNLVRYIVARYDPLICYKIYHGGSINWRK